VPTARYAEVFNRALKAHSLSGVPLLDGREVARRLDGADFLAW